MTVELLGKVCEHIELYRKIYGDSNKIYTNTMLATKLYISTCKLYNNTLALAIENGNNSNNRQKLANNLNDGVGYAILLLEKAANFTIQDIISSITKIREERRSEYNTFFDALEFLDAIKISDLMLMKSIRIMELVDRLNEKQSTEKQANGDTQIMSDKLVDNLLDYIIYAGLYYDKALFKSYSENKEQIS